jgi:hypothetical protein
MIWSVSGGVFDPRIEFLGHLGTFVFFQRMRLAVAFSPVIPIGKRFRRTKDPRSRLGRRMLALRTYLRPSLSQRMMRAGEMPTITL